MVFITAFNGPKLIDIFLIDEVEEVTFSILMFSSSCLKAFMTIRDFNSIAIFSTSLVKIVKLTADSASSELYDNRDDISISREVMSGFTRVDSEWASG